VTAGGAKAADTEHYVLRLYVAGSPARSTRAIELTRHICDTHLKDRHELAVIDLNPAGSDESRSHHAGQPDIMGAPR
jgi:circadian clock protein KaiB